MGKKRAATRFLKGFGDVLRAKSEADTRLGPVVAAFETALKGQIGKSPGVQPDLPLVAEIQPLLERADADGSDVQELLRATNDAVQWYQCYPGEGVSEELSGGLIAAHVVGSRGILKSDALLTGFFLIGPNVDYPLHDHISDELYYVVSGEVHIQNGMNNPPRLVKAGDYSVTPSGMPHRLQTEDTPVLIVFAWTGTVDCNVWWWDHVGGEQWRRTVPPRAIGPITTASTAAAAKAATTKPEAT